jgi:predicted transcriptional regulator
MEICVENSNIVSNSPLEHCEFDHNPFAKKMDGIDTTDHHVVTLSDRFEEVEKQQADVLKKINEVIRALNDVIDEQYTNTNTQIFLFTAIIMMCTWLMVKSFL